MGEPVPDPSARPPAADGERRRESARSTRLIAVFFVGCVGFVGPLLRATSHQPPAGFWPLPFVFLFGFWLVLIVLIALALRSRPGD